MTNSYGDLIFFRPRSMIGRLIRYFDKGPFSHMGIYVGEINEVPMFIDSDWDGVKIRPLMEWGNYEIVPKPYEPHFSFHDIVTLHYGKDYDYAHFIALFLNKLVPSMFPLTKTDDDSFVCSEFANYIFRFMLRGTATPNNFYNKLTS